MIELANTKLTSATTPSAVAPSGLDQNSRETKDFGRILDRKTSANQGDTKQFGDKNAKGSAIAGKLPGGKNLPDPASDNATVDGKSTATTDKTGLTALVPDGEGQPDMATAFLSIVGAVSPVLSVTNTAPETMPTAPTLPTATDAPAAVVPVVATPVVTTTGASVTDSIVADALPKTAAPLQIENPAFAAAAPMALGEHIKPAGTQRASSDIPAPAAVPAATVVTAAPASKVAGDMAPASALTAQMIAPTLNPTANSQGNADAAIVATLTTPVAPVAKAVADAAVAAPATLQMTNAAWAAIANPAPQQDNHATAAKQIAALAQQAPAETDAPSLANLAAKPTAEPVSNFVRTAVTSDMPTKIDMSALTAGADLAQASLQQTVTSNSPTLAPAMPQSQPSQLAAVAAPNPNAVPVQDIAALVDRLVEARNAASQHSVHGSVAHSEFGRVSLRFDRSEAGLNVAMTSVDPDFNRAVQAALPVDRPAPAGDNPSQNSSGNSAQRSLDSGLTQQDRGAAAQQERSAQERSPQGRGTRSDADTDTTTRETGPAARKRGGVFA